jgi:purine-binding chemotaxis protein CheW
MDQEDLHLVFAAGQANYALPSAAAAEVVTHPQLLTTPGSPAHVLGVFAHRGEMVPLVDLALLLDGTPEPSKRAVLVRVSAGTLAFSAREVLGVVPITGTPASLSTSGVYRHLKAPARAPDRDVTVIEAEGLWNYLSHRAGGV